jgi:hypothetical protein
MNPAAFRAAALPFATWASQATGVEVPVILAQWADENGYVWPPPGNNPGNVGNTEHGGQVTYPTVSAGVAAYIATMQLPYYTQVRDAPTWEDQCYALGASPWAAGHYNASGGKPGSDLVKIIEANGWATSPPPPPPIPPEDIVDAFENSKGQTVIVGNTGNPPQTVVITQGADANVVGGWSVANVTAAIEKAYPGTVVVVE